MKPGTGMAALGAALFACSLASTSASAQGSLYDRLGGYPAVSAVVDDFVKNVAADRRINGFFAHTDIPSFRQKLTDFICVGTVVNAPPDGYTLLLVNQPGKCDQRDALRQAQLQLPP